MNEYVIERTVPGAGEMVDAVHEVRAVIDPVTAGAER